MSKYYSIAKANGVVGCTHAVFSQTRCIAIFRLYEDAEAYVAHREYVEKVNAECDALATVPEARSLKALVVKGPGTLSSKQIAWAETHDWHRFSGHGGVVVYDSVANDTVAFRNWAELRAWAGY